MTDPRERGALLGVSNAGVIALSYALFGETYGQCGIMRCPWFFENDVPTTFLAVFMLAMPVGILWGVVLGVLAREIEGSWFLRWFGVTFVALVLATASSLPWPELIVWTWLPTALHASVLTWWTLGAPLEL